jgi:hypothetical protein
VKGFLKKSENFPKPGGSEWYGFLFNIEGICKKLENFQKQGRQNGA